MEQNLVIQALASALAPHLGAVAKASGSPTSVYAYSEGGLFGSCKNDPVLINAIVGPMGYMGKLRWMGTDIENPIVESLTYIGSTTYDQTGYCGDCGKPVIKRCAQSSCFGRICQQTEEFAFDEIGLRANRNVPILAMFGNITDPSGNVLIRQGEEIRNMFTLEVAAAAYNLRRQIGVDVWTGNPAANVGGRWFMTGFDLLINTGKIDVLTNIACDALDSVIYNYNNQIVGAAGSADILSVISGMVQAIRFRLAGAGFDPDAATIDIVMHPTIWDCVASAVACDYGLKCEGWSATNRSVINDSREAARMLERLRNGMILPVDGKDYGVTLDSGIQVTNKPVGDETVRCSEIAVITRELPGAPNGGVITWGEYQDFNTTGGQADKLFKQITGNNILKVTDGGRFAVGGDIHNVFCFDARILSKPRVRMLMPWTAGRITNVCCSLTLGPDQYPDVTGSGGIYEVDGGALTSPANYLYGDCWPTHVGRGAGPQ